MKTRSFLLLFGILIMGSCHSQPAEDNIVLINVGNYDKGRIAKVISKINTLNPKVISLDIAFPEYTGGANDKSLFLALRGTKKLVLPSEISSEGQDYQGNEIISIYLTCVGEFFVPYAKTGFVSAKVERDQIQIPKQFIVWQKGSYSEDIYHHFSVVTAMAFDSLKAAGFVQNHERVVDVDYKNGRRKFRTFSASEILNDKLTKSDIEGKIVMMGFLGPGVQDKFFTPFNTNSNEPDMYGLQYLANIVAQILEYNQK
jgi:CHASE2 domain-containing sensor protein